MCWWPLLRDYVNPLLVRLLGWTGFFSDDNPTGLGYISAAVILAIMILPIISSLTREVMTAVPALAARSRAGARRHTLGDDPHGRAAQCAHRHRGGVILGLGSRAGRNHGRSNGDWQQPRHSAFAAGQRQSMASVIANEYAEATSDLHRSALTELGLALFIVTIIVNALARDSGLGRDARNTGAGALKAMKFEACSSRRNRFAAERKSNPGQRYAALTDSAVTGLAILATLLVVAPLVAIFVYLIYKGASSLNLAFFTQIQKPVGESGGGMAHAIVRLGGAAGAGHGHRRADRHWRRHLSRRVRSRNEARQRNPVTADVLNGVPSIVMGVAAYALIVGTHIPFLPFTGHFSAFAGARRLEL